MSDEATIAFAETNLVAEPRRRTRRTLGLDLATSYALAAARVGSNAIVVGLLYRYTTATWVATFILMRSMLGIANYLLAGLGPATLRELTRPLSDEETPDAVPAIAEVAMVEREAVLDYATPPAFAALTAMPPASRRANALAASASIAVPLGIVALIYGSAFPELHAVALTGEKLGSIRQGVTAYAFGLIFRGASDAAGAAIQWAGKLWVDNAIVIACELAFVVLAWRGVAPKHAYTFDAIGSAFALSGFAAFVVRWFVAGRTKRRPDHVPLIDRAIFNRIAMPALLVSVGAFADFLYAPANVVLINQTLDPTLLAAYGPALQIDAALLLTIAALAPVLLPRVANAIAEHDVTSARRMYVLAMLAGTAVLLAAAATVLIARGPLLRLWLGQVPPVTLSILPLVLVHTVIGGTAGIGRAVLLGMGRFKAYTVSALVGGVANVALALLFVLGFGWGLRGIVCATIVAVVGRCAIWMPWYILRALREPAVAPNSGAPAR